MTSFYQKKFKKTNDTSQRSLFWLSIKHRTVYNFPALPCFKHKSISLHIQMRWSQFSSANFSTQLHISRATTVNHTLNRNENHRLIKYKFLSLLPARSLKFNLTDESREEIVSPPIICFLCPAIIHNQIIHNFHRKYERSMCLVRSTAGSERANDRRERARITQWKTFKRSKMNVR